MKTIEKKELAYEMAEAAVEMIQDAGFKARNFESQGLVIVYTTVEGNDEYMLCIDVIRGNAYVNDELWDTDEMEELQAYFREVSKAYEEKRSVPKLYTSMETFIYKLPTARRAAFDC